MEIVEKTIFPPLIFPVLKKWKNWTVFQATAHFLQLYGGKNIAVFSIFSSPTGKINFAPFFPPKARTHLGHGRGAFEGFDFAGVAEDVVVGRFSPLQSGSAGNPSSFQCQSKTRTDNCAKYVRPYSDSSSFNGSDPHYPNQKTSQCHACGINIKREAKRS